MHLSTVRVYILQLIRPIYGLDAYMHVKKSGLRSQLPIVVFVLVLFRCFCRDPVKLLRPYKYSQRFSKELTIFFTTSSKNRDDR